MEGKKSLLEELRELTSEFNISEEKPSLKDIVDDEDKYADIEDSTYEEDELSDEEEMEHDEEDDENDFDIDDDGEEDDVHDLYLLKSAFNATEDESKHILISFVKLVLDNSVTLESLEQFLNEVDYEDEDEDELSDEEIFSDEEDFDSEDEEDNEEDEDTEEDEEEDIEEDYITNEALMIDEYDTGGMEQFLD